MEHCLYCQAPVVLLMVDCPNCERAYPPPEKCAEIQIQTKQFNPEIIQDLDECGLNSSWIFRSYAVKQYYIARQEGRMSRDELKRAIAAIKHLLW
jgi:hypothetical protein